MQDRFDASKVQWSDDEESFEDKQEPEVGDDDFAKMMATDDTDPIGEDDLRVGEKVRGVIAEIREGSGEVLIDLGGKAAGSLARDELGEDAKVGDEIEAVIVELNGNDAQLSIRRSADMHTRDQLVEAMRGKLPVRGKVVGVNKGGFEVKIGGQKGFCPVSQMDTQFIHDKSKYLNRDFDFIVQKVSGKDVLVSRQAALEIEREKEIDRLVENFEQEKDKVFEGRVTEIRDFGAFVEVAGLEGMIHISELAHGHVSRVADVVTVGDRVRVKLLKIERQGGRTKVAMTMKGAAQDPWESIDEYVKAGESYKGEVVRLADFGAFVELRPGIDGVVHISEMSWVKRIKHPSEVLKPGQVVDVRVIQLDREKRRISLTMKSIEDDPWYSVKDTYAVGTEHEATVERLKTFGAIMELASGISAMLPITVLKSAFSEAYKKKAQPGAKLMVTVAEIDLNQKRIRLSLPGIETDEDGKDDFKEYEQKQQEQEQAPSEGRALGSFGELLQASMKKKK